MNIDKVLAFTTGILISIISAWYSVVGLTAIFAGAFWSIIIMGSVLEFSKIITASYLYRNWNITQYVMKLYLVAAVVALMAITSMGTFGYLSKAHIEYTADTFDVQAKIDRIDQNIQRERTNITRAEQALNQLDGAINVMIAADRATVGLQTRTSQISERTILNNTIVQSQANIDKLSDERSPLSQQVRNIQREVGPIRFVAELFYGKSDQAIIEKSVRYVIIMLVLVLDPLAILLIMITTRKDLTLSTIKGQVRGIRGSYKKRNAVSVDGDKWEKDVDVFVQQSNKSFIKKLD